MFFWKEIEQGSSAATAERSTTRLVWREISPRPSLYDELGVNLDATPAEIRQAFRRRALELHPDRATNERTAHDAMARLNEVYRTLGSDERRRAYDRSLG